MIANSHPYNPSHLSQQQRCVGLNQNQQQQLHSQEAMNRILASGGGQQQNLLYGSPTYHLTGNEQQQQQQSHMLDLANLQQGAFTDSPPNYNENNANNSNNKNFNVTDNLRNNSRRAGEQQQNDISLYSPSSSTSLLNPYHIYDQINLPEQQQYQQASELVAAAASAANNANNNNSSKKANTTILNPASLFGQQRQAPSLPLPLPMQLHHQHQLSQVAELQAKGQQQQQPECYSTSASSQYHLQHAFNNTMQPAAYNALAHHQASNLMLDTVLRQHHANTTARQHQHQYNQGHHHHQQQPRPLSSSAGSSNSGQITYGRQARVLGANGASGPVPGLVGSGKSQSDLIASVLQSSNTLSHLGIGHSSPSNRQQTNNCAKFNYLFSNSRCKRMSQRVRHIVYEYQTIFKCSLLLILLAFSLMSIIKFSLLSASSSAQVSNGISSSISNNLAPIYPSAYQPKCK